MTPEGAAATLPADDAGRPAPPFLMRSTGPVDPHSFAARNAVRYPVWLRPHVRDDGPVQPDLPDDVDPDLWFPCSDVPGERDYLYAAAWHTFPGRMGAYCPAKKVYFRASARDISDDAPPETKYWVGGYLAGSLPAPADPEMGDEARGKWKARAAKFFATGNWSSDEETA